MLPVEPGTHKSPQIAVLPCVSCLLPSQDLASLGVFICSLSCICLSPSLKYGAGATPVLMTQPYTSCIAWHNATLKYWLDKRDKRKEILVEVEDPNSDRGELLRL